MRFYEDSFIHRIYIIGNCLIWPTNITGRIVDENGNPIGKALLHYGKDYVYDDTAYSDKAGRFKVSYPNPQRFWYFFSIEKAGYFPKTFFVDLDSNDIAIEKPFVIRSRKGFWYDPKQIDSSHIGMTVREAVTKFKLAIDECILWNEPPGAYHNFTTELCDSSYIRFIFQGVFSKKRLKMKDVLDRKIIGIGISFIDGTEKVIGNGFTPGNPYLIEREMKLNK